MCDRVYVFHAYDCSEVSHFSLSGHPTTVRVGRPLGNEIPEPLNHILKVTHFYLCIKKASTLSSCTLSLGLYNQHFWVIDC